MNSAIEILEVIIHHPDGEPPLLGFLDSPHVSDRLDGYHFAVTGWIISQSHTRPVAVEYGIQDMALGVAPIDQSRPDVAAAFPAEVNAASSGFAMEVSVLALPTEFTITLTVVCENADRVSFGEIRGRHAAVAVHSAAAYTPVMVTCLGRTGTTLLMQMLADHPEIVAERNYPYETRYASYWTHLFGVLADSGDQMRPVEWIPYFGNSTIVRSNPFTFRHYPHAMPVRHWLGKEYVERLATFCQQSIEGFYEQVARSQNEQGAHCYAEKVYPDRTPDLLWQINPQAREIFSVRDCRDMLCSIIGFVQDSERTLLGYAQVDDVEAFVGQLRTDLSLLLTSWRRRSDRAHVVRYEDLVANPVEVARGICNYLGVDASPLTIEQMARHATADTAAYRGHRTSDSLAASVGRWRHELSPSVQRLCQEMYAAVLDEFGYT